MHFLDKILPVIENTLRGGGIWIILIVAIAEALPLIGSFIPGHIVIILGGFLAKLGVFNFWYVVIVAGIGAMTGDVIGYFVGKKYGMSFLTKYGPYFFINERHISRANSLLNSHTGKALVLGRFSPITRAFIPFLAGVSGVEKGKFWFFNIIGGTCWAFLSVSVGYIFGASYEYASIYIGKYILMAFVLGIFIVWIYFFLEKRQHLFSRRNLITLCINVISLFIFFKFIEDIFSFSAKLVNVDVWFNLLMVGMESPLGIGISRLFTLLADEKTAILISLIIVIGLFLKKRWHLIQFYLFNIIGGLSLGFLLKRVIERARPENALLVETSFSFPSGHAMTAGLVYGALAYLFYRSNLKKNTKILLNILLVIIVIGVMWSRIYLRVHWLSDVLGGLSFSIFWLTLSMLIFHVLGKQKERLSKIKNTN
ncbi:MAG: bifunctional DedA family/phosphatase PAP2 family protein [bacterium]|nr:bifunctional DedA family/phosphatase PAP2 family protein [bacterium]